MTLLLVLLEFVLAERFISDVELFPEMITEIKSSPDVSKRIKEPKRATNTTTTYVLKDLW